MATPGGVSVNLGSLVIDADALAAFVRSGNGPVMNDLMRRAGNVQTGARHFVRKHTRTLERSIVKRAGVDAKGPYVAVVTEGVPYAMYEHDGTEPHVIRPRTKKVLRFPAGGAVVFARVVHHPGTAGSKFMTRALPLAAR